MEAVKSAEPRPGEIVVEVDIERHVRYHYTHNFEVPVRKSTKMARSGNGFLDFRPFGQVRSRMLFNRSPGTKYADHVSSVDFIPGQYIHIDVDNRLGRISDPLGYPANKDLYEAIKAAGREGNANPRDFPDFSGDPHSGSQEYQLATDEDLWTWLFWLRRVCDVGCSDLRPIDKEGEWTCRPIQNVHELPSLYEILATRKAVIVNNPEVTSDLKNWTHDVRKGDEKRGRPGEPNYDPDRDRDHLTPEFFGVRS